MRLPAPRAVFSRYAVTWVYLAAFVIAQVIYALLSARGQAAVIGWASTNVHNLSHEPVGPLVASAFFAQSAPAAWPFLIALALFGANHALGNWRTALVCAAGHVIGTLVSEGVVGYRVSHGLLPAADRYLVDVGPSYIVVSAAVVALLYGTWVARLAAVIDLVVLIGPGDIFGGLSHLDVAAVGHVTAMTVAALCGSLLAWQLRKRRGRPQAPVLGEEPGPAVSAGQPG
jgi:hypothetical protein